MFGKKNYFDEFVIRFSPLNDMFGEVHGCIVNKSHWEEVEESVRRLLDEGWSRENVEKHINHTHMGLMIAWNFGSKVTPERLRQMADLTAATLRYRLKAAFPDKDFVVEEWNEDDGDLTVSFYQRRTALET